MYRPYCQSIYTLSIGNQSGINVNETKFMILTQSLKYESAFLYLNNMGRVDSFKFLGSTSYTEPNLKVKLSVEAVHIVFNKMRS